MDYWIDIFNVVLIFSIFTISLNLLIGYAGQVSVAHAAFGAIGGYAAAYLQANAGFSFWPGLAAGTFGAGLIGLLMSLPALRLRPEYLVLLTIAVSAIVLAIVGAVAELGGAYGITASRPADLWPIPGGPLLFPTQWTLPLIGFAAPIFFVCWRMGQSAWGRVLRGIRDDEVATRALGHNVYIFKVIVFSVTSAFAGLAGVLLFFYNQIVSPSVYGLDVSLKIFAMTIFGGLGNFVGSILGTAVVQLLQPILENLVKLEPGNAFLIQLVIYGIGLAILVRVRPQGLLPEGVSLLPARAAERVAPPSVRSAASTKAVDIGSSRPSQLQPPTGAGPILEVRGLSKQFGGIVACRDLSLDLETGKIAALVGPNGAGKTTVFNLLTGAFGADSGSIKLNGEELCGLGPDAVARKGMARTFQDVRLFARMSALENVMLAMRGIEGGSGGEKFSDLFLHPRRAARAERSERDGAMEHLRLVGLADFAGTAAGALSYGQQKLVSFARLMATDADVLLLDEPASGVDARWVDKLLELVVYARDRGKTICIVEHSLHVVEQLADTAFFMELGHITAKGTIRELTSDPRLAEVYFGTV